MFSIVIFLAGFPGMVAAQFEFPTDYALGSSATAVQHGDLNLDGKPDIVATTSGSSAVSILFGDGTGRFSISSTASIGSGLRDVAIGDMNSDGKPDLVVVRSNDPFIHVLLGNGDGTFQPPIASSVGSPPDAIAVADLNLDGRVDVVIADSIGSMVVVALGDGAGAINALGAYPLFGNPVSVTLADIDHNGYLDIVTADMNAGTSIFLGQNGGGFSPPHVYFVFGASPAAAGVGDFNLDGDNDVCVATGGGSVLSILIGDGTGLFGTPYGYSTGSLPTGLAVADLNSDGVDDIATSNLLGNSITAFYGIGDGHFDFDHTYPLGNAQQPQGLDIADFRIDGRPDVATANSNGSASVILNNHPEIGGGSFGAGQSYSLNIPNQTGQYYFNAMGDVNNDGHPDLVVVGPDNVSSTANILLGTATGSFSAAAQIAGFAIGVYSQPALIDVNADGNLDFLCGEGINVSVRMGDGGGLFGSKVTYNVGNPWTTAIRGGDLDCDGTTDVVVSNYSTSLYVLTNDGSGGFSTAPVLGSPAADDIQLGDLNHDGIEDVVSAHRISGVASICMGDGTGSFSTPTDYFISSSNNYPRTLVRIQDFNCDGQLDFAAKATSTTIVYYGNGSGVFPYSTTIASENGELVYSIDSEDMNDDGRKDIIVEYRIVSDQRFARVYYGTGAIGFSAALTQTPIVSSWHPVSVQRLDLDAKPDLVVVQQDGAVHVYLADSTQSNVELFQTVASYPQTSLSHRAYSVATGDLNMDGWPDFVTANPNNNTISVGLGYAPGCIGARVDYAEGNKPAAVCLGDFDTDGILDVAVANRTSNTISIRKGSLAGALGASATFAAGGSPVALVSGNLNSNGTPDLVVANFGAFKISLFESNGTSTFTSITTLATTGSGPNAIALGDFDANSAIDIAVSLYTTNAVDVFLGLGNGAFTVQTPYSILANATPMDVAVGDLGSDGSLDLVTANSGLNNIAHSMNTGIGTFGGFTFTPAGVGTESIAIGNLNGDGFTDVVAANAGGYDVTVYLGLGSGQAAPVQSYLMGFFPRSLVIADLNLDAKADLIAAGYWDLAVLQNTGVTPGGMSSFESTFGTGGIGLGTQGCSGRIAMSANRSPKINTSDFAFTFTHAPRSVLALGYFGDSDSTGSDPFSLGVTMNVDFLSQWFPPYFFDIYTDIAGIGWGPAPIPNDTSLIGLVVYVQGLFVENQPGGWACSPSIFHCVTSEAKKFVVLP